MPKVYSVVVNGVNCNDYTWGLTDRQTDVILSIWLIRQELRPNPPHRQYI